MQHKDRSAVLWRKNAARLTGVEWRYRKVLQKEYEKLHPTDFEEQDALEPVMLL